MYHIFRVWDYKGGELSSSVNLDRETLIDNLAERMYESHLDESHNTLDKIKERVKRLIVQKYDGNDFLGTHEGFMGEIYQTSNDGKLIQLKWSELVDELSIKLFEWFKDDQE